MNTEFSFIVIDDSELDRFVIQKVIEHTDKSLSIKTYQNAQHALEIIGNHSQDDKRPAIILLDLHMPGMNGFEFVEEFEKFPPEVQNNYLIIILSILSSTRITFDINSKLINGKINNIVEKPLTIEKLLSLLNKLKSDIQPTKAL